MKLYHIVAIKDDRVVVPYIGTWIETYPGGSKKNAFESYLI